MIPPQEWRNFRTELLQADVLALGQLLPTIPKPCHEVAARDVALASAGGVARLFCLPDPSPLFALQVLRPRGPASSLPWSLRALKC